jgi:predicted small metal-binding protein
MAKVIDCGKVNPASGCGHIIRAETKDELLRQAAEHAAKDHGMQPSPELMAQVKAHIEEG